MLYQFPQQPAAAGSCHFTTHLSALRISNLLYLCQSEKWKMVSLSALFIWECELIFMCIVRLLVTCHSFPFFKQSIHILCPLLELVVCFFGKNCLERKGIHLLSYILQTCFPFVVFLFMMGFFAIWKFSFFFFYIVSLGFFFPLGL